MTDTLEQTLTAALTDAQTDPRWSGHDWPDAVRRVRRAGRASRTRHAAAAVASLAVVAGAGAVAVHSVTAGEDRVGVFTTAGGGDGSGLDWLLTPEQYSAYAAAQPSPSYPPSLVASPAPADDELTKLRTDVFAALGRPRTLRLDPADGGRAGHAVIWATTSDSGTPVAIERYRLDYPVVAGSQVTPAPTAGSQRTTSEEFTDPRLWADGTAYTVATGDQMGYAFGPDQQWSGPVVWTVTADGWFTSWTAPVSADRLLAWAQAADASFDAG
jgi:hypothetical protein